MLTPDVSVQDGLKCRRVISHDFLLNVKNGNVRGDGDLTTTESPQQRRFTNTVLTDKTIAMTIGESQGTVREDTLARDGDVEAIDLDVLALVTVLRTQHERVDGHVKFFIALRLVGLVEKSGGLIFDSLECLAVLLSTQLTLSLFELLAVNAGFDLASTSLFKINCTTSEAEGRGYVPLGSHVNGLFQLLG